jgi:hypothetical protein
VAKINGLNRYLNRSPDHWVESKNNNKLKSRKPKPFQKKKPKAIVEQKSHLAQYPKSQNLSLEVPGDGNAHPDPPLVTKV